MEINKKMCLSILMVSNLVTQVGHTKTTEILKLSLPKKMEIDKATCDVIEEQFEDAYSGRGVLEIYKTDITHYFDLEVIPRKIGYFKLSELKVDLNWSSSSLSEISGLWKHFEKNINKDIESAARSSARTYKIQVDSKILLCDLWNEKLEIEISAKGVEKKIILGPVKMTTRDVLNLSRSFEKQRKKIQLMEVGVYQKNNERSDLALGALIGWEISSSGKKAEEFLGVEELVTIRNAMFDPTTRLSKNLSFSDAKELEQSLRSRSLQTKDFKVDLSIAGTGGSNE